MIRGPQKVIMETGHSRASRGSGRYKILFERIIVSCIPTQRYIFVKNLSQILSFVFLFSSFFSDSFSLYHSILNKRWINKQSKLCTSSKWEANHLNFPMLSSWLMESKIVYVRDSPLRVPLWTVLFPPILILIMNVKVWGQTFAIQALGARWRNFDHKVLCGKGTGSICKRKRSQLFIFLRIKWFDSNPVWKGKKLLY